jgi:hypothetical protein
VPSTAKKVLKFTNPETGLEVVIPKLKPSSAPMSPATTPVRSALPPAQTPPALLALTSSKISPTIMTPVTPISGPAPISAPLDEPVTTATPARPGSKALKITPPVSKALAFTSPPGASSTASKPASISSPSSDLKGPTVSPSSTSKALPISAPATQPERASANAEVVSQTSTNAVNGPSLAPVAKDLASKAASGKSSNVELSDTLGHGNPSGPILEAEHAPSIERAPKNRATIESTSKRPATAAKVAPANSPESAEVVTKVPAATKASAVADQGPGSVEGHAQESNAESKPKHEMLKASTSSADGMSSHSVPESSADLQPKPTDSGPTPLASTARTAVMPDIGAAGKIFPGQADTLKHDDLPDAGDGPPTGSRSPPRRPRRPSLKFEDGERRRYPLQFVMSVRSFIPKDMDSSLVQILTSSGLCKWVKSDKFQAAESRDNPRRSSGGPVRGMYSQNGDSQLKGMRRPEGASPFMKPDRDLSRDHAVPGVFGTGYDPFDKLITRARLPPPPFEEGSGGQESRSGSSGGFFDPRGTGQLAPLPGQVSGRGPRRGDGPTRMNNTGPMDYYTAPPPTQKLTKSDNSWSSRKKESDDEVTSKVKQVRSHLNKLTLEKFDRIFSQIVELDISNVEVLRGIVNEIFEKTLNEPLFASMYAELCRRLNIHYDSSDVKYTDDNGKQLTFRRVLLKNCQNEFVRFEHQAKEGAEIEANAASQADGNEGSEETKKMKAEAYTKAMEAKKRMLGNVRFIGELYKKDLLPETIIHRQCIHPLLTLAIQKKEDDVIEALCTLLSRTGKKLSESTSSEAKKVIDNYFASLERLSMDHTLPARVRFMLQDLADQRKNGWNLRREDQSAKTVSEIKEDIRKEERAKEQAAQAARSRQGRGGGGGSGFGRDRAPTSFAPPPRIPMQMAPARPGATAGGTRNQSLLDKYAGRGTASGASSTSAASAGGVRLGPSTRPGGQWKSSSTGNTSLKPDGHRAGSGGGSSVLSGGKTAGNAFEALATPEPWVSQSSNAVTSSTSSDGKSLSESSNGGEKLQVRSQVYSAPRGLLGKVDSAHSKGALRSRSVAGGVMDADKLKRKTSAIITEYWTINDLKEARECVALEIQPPNYASFVAEVLRICLEARAEDQAKTIPLYRGLLDDTVPSAIMKEGFAQIISKLTDLEMDNPRASEIVARYLGALAASGLFGSSPSDALYGLGFLRDAIVKVDDKKKAMKFVVLVLRALAFELPQSLGDEKTREAAVRQTYLLLGIDLKLLAVQWNPVRGLSSLQELLSSTKSGFLLPFISSEMELPAMLQKGKGPSDIISYLRHGVPATEYYRAPFARALISAFLTWALPTPSDGVKFANRFESTCAPVLKTFCIKDGMDSPSVDLQMSILLETQAWLSESAEKLAPMKSVKAASLVFQSLYDEDIVEEDTFLKWKDDTDLSLKVKGKSDALLGAGTFFTWLATAEEGG